MIYERETLMCYKTQSTILCLYTNVIAKIMCICGQLLVHVLQNYGGFSASILFLVCYVFLFTDFCKCGVILLVLLRHMLSLVHTIVP